MHLSDVVWLLSAGCIAGSMNALAGGGSFVTLPALVAVGFSALESNATSSVALFPGGAVSAFVYRGGASAVCEVPIRRLLVAGVVGGCCGALLLLWTPTTVFDHLLPWLLLTATLALAFGPRLLRAHTSSGLLRDERFVLLIQMLLGVYAGYFGGAVGLLMIAAWRLLGEQDIKSLNRPRTLLVTTSNTAAIALLIPAGLVRWSGCIPLSAGALAGGYLGARLGQRLSPQVVRVLTMAISISITIAFFVRAYRLR